MPRIGRIAQHNGEAVFAFHLVDRLRFMGESRNGEGKAVGEILRRFEGIRKVDARALVAGEAIARFVELEADLQVGDGVRSHQKLVTVEMGQEMRRDVVVPEVENLLIVVPLALPLLGKRAVDDVYRLDEERAGARGGVEDGDEAVGWFHAFGDRQALVAVGHLSPGGDISKTIRKSKLRLQQLVN